MKIALLGGTGRVGRHLAAEALSMGHDVTVIAPDLDWTWFAPAAEIADGPRTGSARRGSMLVT
ncbi:MAG: hypothetical protein V4636_22740, partial [Pseudomonadota bacterium]